MSTNHRDIENIAWKFQNLDKTFPSRSIKQGEKSSLLEHSQIHFDVFRIEDSDNDALDLSAFVEATETDGLIVIHDEEIAFEYYGRANTENLIHVMMSLTKSVVGIVAGILVGHPDILWQPMLAESHAYVVTYRGGNARTSGGICATLRDIARVGQLLVHRDNAIIPESWIHDVIHNGSTEAFNGASWQKDFQIYFKTIAYRSYWLADSDSETLIAIGIHGQLMIVDRSSEIVMAKVSSQPSRLDARKELLTVAAFKEFQRILFREKSRVGKPTSTRQINTDGVVGPVSITQSATSFVRVLLSRLKRGERKKKRVPEVA